MTASTLQHIIAVLGSSGLHAAEPKNPLNTNSFISMRYIHLNTCVANPYAYLREAEKSSSFPRNGNDTNVSNAK